VRDKAVQELKKLEAMPPMSAESTVSRNYLDWLLAVPWKKRSQGDPQYQPRREVPKRRSLRVGKIKDRILEFLAVRQTGQESKGSILCFVGPPGVGKTSLGMSIAKATGRKFVRMSLGGVRDEAEIAATAAPTSGAPCRGKSFQMMKKAGTKIRSSWLDRSRQDVDGLPRRPSARCSKSRPRAELHVVDHTLTWNTNLSQVFFVATPTSSHTIPTPCRLDGVLRLHGYTRTEKVRDRQNSFSAVAFGNPD